MYRLPKIAMNLLLGAGALLASVSPSNAQYQFQPIRPDLRIASVGPSSVGPLYVRVVVVNQGWWGAGPFTVRVRILSATPVVRNFTLPGVAKNSSIAFDVYMGSSMLARGGLVTDAYADIYNAVTESNESNNKGSYIAPPR
jgi:hypothetical protein